MNRPTTPALTLERPALDLAWLPNAAAALTIGLGLAVMAGWLLDIEAAKRVLPHFETMKFNAALGLTGLGIALWLRDVYPTNAGARWVAAGLALAVMALGAISLAQYLGGWDFGIDRSFVIDATPGIVHPGRMAPHTAVSFVLMAGALLAPHRRIGHQGVREWLVIAVMFIALLALIGQSYRATPLYAASRYNGMALHTSLALLVLGCGTLALGPRQRFMQLLLGRNAGGATARMLLPAALTVPIVLSWLLVHEGTRIAIDDQDLAQALAVAAGMALLVALIWRHARVLNQLERANAQAAAAQSLALLKTVSESTNEAIYVKDRATRLVFANPAAMRILRATARSDLELIGVANNELFRDPRTAERITANDLHVMESGRAESFEELLRLPEGERCFLSRKAPLRDEQGHITGLVGISTDITEHKAAQAEAQRAAERAEVAQEAARATLYEYRPATGKVYRTPALQSVLGYSMAEVEATAQGWQELIHPDDLERAWSIISAGLANGTGFSVEYRVRHKDGHHVWMHDRGRVVRDAHGNVERLVGMVVDITERKVAEAALHESEARLRIALDSADMGMHVWDVASSCVVWDAQVRKLWAIGPDEPVDYDVFMAGVHPDDRAATQAAVDRALDPSGSGRYFAEYRVVGRDDRVTRWVSATGQVFFAGGRPMRMIGTARDITRRVNAEERLRTSEERLRLAAETARFGVHDYDVTHRSSVWTHELYALTGMDPSTAITLETTLALIHAEDRERVGAAMDAALDPQGTGEFEEEFRIVRADTGETRWLHNRSRTFFAESCGKRTAVRNTGIVIDITEQKRARAALAESEARYRILTEVAPQIVWTADPEGKVTYANQYWFDYSGQVREQSVGEGWAQALHPDDRDALLATFRTALATGDPYQIEARLRRADGEYRWHIARAEPQRDSEGRIVQWLGVSSDIHERRLAEETLRDHEARMRFVLEATEVGLWLNELPLGRLNWDEQTRKLFFVPTGVEPTIELFWERLHPQDREATRQAVSKALAEHSTYTIEHRVVNPGTGEIRWVRSAGRATYDEQGKATRFDGLNYDITERKRVEEALRRYADQLKAADRRKDEFLAMLAHELRNPLAPVRNAAAVLARQPSADAATRKMTEVIERQVQHMARLVDDLLDVSRVTEGKITLKRERVELHHVLQNGIEVARPLIDAKGHRLHVSVPPQPLALEGDATRLAQVIGNLLHNAAKYTDPGGEIEIAAQREREMVVIRVRDNGVGIGPELLPHVFDLFTQGDRSLHRSQGGLGIGLALVQRLVEMHGGRVSAASRGPGHGSEFSVYLPAASVTHTRDPGSDAAARSRPRRILVVDDSRDAADSLGVMLELGGHEVRCVYDAASALATARDFAAEVILLDLALPGMHGYDIAKRLRTIEATRRAKIVALTGYGQPEDRAQWIEAGFDDYVIKPVDPAALSALIASGGER